MAECAPGLGERRGLLHEDHRGRSPQSSPGEVPKVSERRRLWAGSQTMYLGKVKVMSLSRVRLLATPWTAAHQAPPSMGFSRQEYWSGVPLPSPSVTLQGYKIGNKILLTIVIIMLLFSC